MKKALKISEQTKLDGRALRISRANEELQDTKSKSRKPQKGAQGRIDKKNKALAAKEKKAPFKKNTTNGGKSPKGKPSPSPRRGGDEASRGGRKRSRSLNDKFKSYSKKIKKQKTK